MIGSTGHTSQSNSFRSNRIMCSERTHIVYRTETTELDSKQLLNGFEQDLKDKRDVTLLFEDDKRSPIMCKEGGVELAKSSHLQVT